jgi:cytoskeleton protein RodZ
MGAHPESLGGWLAQVRAGGGLELREVARQLRLNPTIIQAIEADDFARLGPPVFVRGYLSRYAQLLELPESEVLERYREQVNDAQAPTLKVVLPIQRQTRVRDLRGLFYLLVLGGIGWAAVEHLDDLNPSRLTALWTGKHPSNSQTVVTTPPTTAAQVQYPFQPQSGETVNEPPSPTSPPTVEPARSFPDPDLAPAIAVWRPPIATVEPAPILAVSGVGTAPAAPTLSVNNVSPDSSAGAKLLLEFSNDCWVEVKDAQGNVLASGMMRANTTRTLSGSAPFKVTLGNAPAARIIFDDRLVDTTVYVPRRGTVSRFTLDRGGQP